MVHPSDPSPSAWRRLSLAAAAVGLAAVVGSLWSVGATALWFPRAAPPSYGFEHPPDVQLAWSAAWLASGAAGVVLAACVAVLALLLARRLGATVLAATSAATALVAGGLVQSAAVVAGPPLGVAALLLAAGIAALGPRRTGVRWAVAASLVLAAVALVGAPIVSGEAAFSAWWRLDLLTAVPARLPRLAGQIGAELGVFGVVLVSLGAMVHRDQRRRLLLIVGLACASALLTACWRLPDWPLWGVVSVALLMPIAAVGMSWLQHAAPRGAARAGAVLLVLALPLMQVVAHHETGGRARAGAALAGRWLAHVAGTVGSDAVLVTADVGLDRIAEPGVQRNPLEIRSLHDVMRAGTAVLAPSATRASLEAIGFVLVPRADIGVPMDFTELLASVPRGWIVAVAASRSFPAVVAPGGGATFRTIGGQEDLFGRTGRHYAAIGVAHGHAPAVEGISPEAVNLSLRAGDDLTPRTRLPVDLGVASDESGAVVRYRGRIVARSSTGIAMAVLSPTGLLERAYDTDDGRIVARPAGLETSQVIGREPCILLSPGQWRDISGVTSLSAIGALLGPGQSLAIYAGGADTIAAVEVPLPGSVTDPVIVETFTRDATTPAASLALRRRLTADGAAAIGDAVLTWPSAARIEARAASAARHVAVDLKQFVSRALARVEPPGGASVEVCAGLPTAGWFAPAGAAESARGREIDMTHADPFLAGWDRVEIAGPNRFRWTRTQAAELRLSLDMPADRRLVLDAWAPGPDVSLGVRVNEIRLPEARLDRPDRTYAWIVPREVWRPGINRVWLEVSSLSEPAARGSVSDDRVLGVAVQRIRIEPAPAVARTP